MTKTTFTQKATAAHVAKKMGLKEGEFEIKLVGKGQWEIVRKNEEPAKAETPVLESGPTAAEEPVRKLEVIDYAAPSQTTESPKPEATPPVETTPVPATAKPERVKTSTVANPVKFVWALCEEMKAADPNATRKALVDACIAKGVAFYTAKTQVQRFLKAKRAGPAA